MLCVCVTDSGEPLSLSIMSQDLRSQKTIVKTKCKESQREGVLAAEATLEGRGLKDLAELIPEILEAATGAQIVFKARIEFGTDMEPDEENVERIDALLYEALGELSLVIPVVLRRRAMA